MTLISCAEISEPKKLMTGTKYISDKNEIKVLIHNAIYLSFSIRLNLKVFQIYQFLIQVRQTKLAVTI